MNKNNYIIIGVSIVIIVLVCLFAFSKKQENKTVNPVNAPDNSNVAMIDGFTREDYARMGYKKADIDLLFA